ncbi:MAG TPA: CRISPR-associated helicase Cas3' [Streptosporangiaceae bacterium]|nr:CRISPR-associated helicase Cas3' [Streptosporangiaceae bacterium]
MEPFEEFFRRATGHPPYGYQSRLAVGGLSAVVQAPTGCGKTGVILAWLWRRLHGPDPAGTPRRLVYALPQRSLVEQVAGEVARWLANLGMAEDVALHVVMGGEGTSQRQWRLDMHRPAIVVGTVDSLVSKALNRGYGIARATYPIDFALVTNGAHWIIDEIQLCPESTTTLRQLAAFTAAFGTAEPFGLTCMSATVPEGLLGTVDNPLPGPDEILRIEPAERTGDLAVRLGGERMVRRLAAGPGQYAAIAAAALERHRPGTLTLVVLNTVDAARNVFKALRGQPVPRTLLHSRFRGVERERLIKDVTAEPEADGRIVVATQVVEAGIDLNAAVLITEAAPWPCVVQRAGRCNRTGLVRDAELWWLPPDKPHPYPQKDVDATASELGRLEGTRVTSEDLLGREVPVTDIPVAVLRKADLVGLFDTAPDLSGADLDIAPYVRDSEDLDAQLAWAVWESAAPNGRPPDDARAPLAPWRCRVPLGQVAALVKRGVAVWRMDQVLGRWTKVSQADRARPGEVLLVAAGDGGYDIEAGLDLAAHGPVPGSPVLQAQTDLTGLAAGAEDTFHDDSASVDQQGWLSLDQHSEDVRSQAEALLAALHPDVPAAAGRSVVTAAYAHDAGKAHPIWQDALCRLGSPERAEAAKAGRPWAKSDGKGRLEFEGRGRFRHELASLLLLDGPLNGLLADATDADADLIRYLVLAHHGKLRVQVREPGDADPGSLLGLVRGAVEEVPPMLGQPGGELKVDLEQFALGGEQSWTRTVLALRDTYRPFVLAYLETVVRIADWRASAGMKREVAR